MKFFSEVRRWENIPLGLSWFKHQELQPGCGIRLMLPVFFPIFSRFYSIHTDTFVQGWRLPTLCLRLSRHRNVAEIHLSWGLYVLGTPASKETTYG